MQLPKQWTTCALLATIVSLSVPEAMAQGAELPAEDQVENYWRPTLTPDDELTAEEPVAEAFEEAAEVEPLSGLAKSTGDRWDRIKAALRDAVDAVRTVAAGVAEDAKESFDSFVAFVKENPLTVATTVITGGADLGTVTATFIGERTVDFSTSVVDRFVDAAVSGTFPERFDLRDYHLVSQVDDQDQDPGTKLTCSAYAIVGALEIEVKKRFMHILPESDFDINLSERKLFQRFAEWDEDPEDIGYGINRSPTVRLALCEMEGYKIGLERNESRSLKPWVKIASHASVPGLANPLGGQYFATITGEKAAIKSAIHKRKCGVIATMVSRDGDINRLTWSGPESYLNVADLHTVVIIGWDDARAAWLVKNSWGDESGGGGYHWLEYGARGICFPHYITGVEFGPVGDWIDELNTARDWVDPYADAYTVNENIGRTWCARAISYDFSYAGPADWGFGTNGMVTEAAKTRSRSISGAVTLNDCSWSESKAYTCGGGELEKVKPELIVTSSNAGLSSILNLLLLD